MAAFLLHIPYYGRNDAVHFEPEFIRIKNISVEA